VSQDSVVGIVTMGWTVWGLNLSGGEIFCTGPDQSWAPSELLYKGMGLFQRIKRLGCGFNHPLSPSAKGEETVGLYSTSTPLLCLHGRL